MGKYKLHENDLTKDPTTKKLRIVDAYEVVSWNGLECVVMSDSGIAANDHALVMDISDGEILLASEDDTVTILNRKVTVTFG